MKASNRKKTCRECGGVYYRRFRQNARAEGWCRPSCYMKDYRRRRTDRGDRRVYRP